MVSVAFLVRQLAPKYAGLSSGVAEAARRDGWPQLPRVPPADARAYRDVDLRAEWEHVQLLGSEALARELAFEKDHTVPPRASTPNAWHGRRVLAPLPRCAWRGLLRPPAARSTCTLPSNTLLLPRPPSHTPPGG